MSLLHVLKAIGFDSDDLESVWGEDRLTRLEERQARLSRALKQRYPALVRRRRVIEKLKALVECDEERRERKAKLLRHHERRYQIRLGETVRLGKKLARLQEELVAERLLARRGRLRV
jgi:hypothetical protein